MSMGRVLGTYIELKDLKKAQIRNKYVQKDLLQNKKNCYQEILHACIYYLRNNL